jgi:hypothetical protein
MGKYGTNLEGFGAFEGGVNADKGAPLVSTSSDGETALLFGPAALREIQTSVANGDFAIPPDAAGDTITEENPLPYWTWTPATGITAAIVTDSGSGSTNILRVTVAVGTYASDTFGVLSRIIPVATSRARDSVYVPLVSLKSASASQPRFKCTYQYLTQDGTNTGTAMARVETAVPVTIGTVSPDSLTNAHTPADAAYLKISISVGVLAGTVAVARTADLCEVRVVSGNPFIYLANRLDPATAPAVLQISSGGLESSFPFYTTVSGSEFADLELTGLLTAGNGITVSAGDVAVVSNIGFDGALYGASNMTGPNINLGGTNTRLWTHSATAADVAASTTGSVAGILITKSTAGQPTTNINGTGTTDAFADALRNGGIASDNTNGRFYVYNGGAWKFAALTTPSDSRLKEEITEITGALDTLRQLMPVAFKWKRPEAHPRTDAVADDGKRLGFIADQVATTDLKGWVEDMGVSELESDLIDTDGRVLAVNIPQNEMEALVVQALLDIDTRLKALESR